MVITGTDKSKTFGMVSAVTAEAGEGGNQITERERRVTQQSP